MDIKAKDGLFLFYKLFCNSLARRFHKGLVTRLNHVKKPRKQAKNVENDVPRVKALFATARIENIKNDKPPKQTVISDVSFRVMDSFGSGLKKENGHQIKSLSESQL